jgi:hypothetical protein
MWDKSDKSGNEGAGGSVTVCVVRMLTRGEGQQVHIDHSPILLGKMVEDLNKLQISYSVLVSYMNRQGPARYSSGLETEGWISEVWYNTDTDTDTLQCWYGFHGLLRLVAQEALWEPLEDDVLCLLWGVDQVARIPPVVPAEGAIATVRKQKEEKRFRECVVDRSEIDLWFRILFCWKISNSKN